MLNEDLVKALAVMSLRLTDPGEPGWYVNVNVAPAGEDPEVVKVWATDAPLLRSFSAVVRWKTAGGAVEKEEVEVKARDLDDARGVLRETLEREYEPGWKVLSVEETRGGVVVSSMQ